MYEDFYKLKEKPFNLNPSPRFLYLSDTHKEALALLTYGVMERKGFILLTGEVGTGKTTIVQTLIAGLDKNIEYIFISNPLMSSNEFLDYIAFNTFQRKVHFKSKADFLLEFEEYLKKCRQQQKAFVLIIDESQTLSYELLEEIRLLSNMESADEKLINIFLIGQPELNDKLAEPRCRPILQRINNRYHLKPLDLKSTSAYISTRLKVAGVDKAEDIFPAKTIKALYEYSGGYPRVINVLADNALLLGYSKGNKKITPVMIEECSLDFDIKTSKNEKQPEVAQKQAQEGPVKSSTARYWKWGFILLLLISMTLAGLMLWRNEPVYQDQTQKPETNNKPMTGISTDKKKPEEKKIQPDKQVIAPADKKEETSAPTLKEPEKEQASPSINDKDKKEEQIDKIARLPQTNKPGFSLVKVKKGDTLTKLTLDIYNRSDNDILETIKLHNPGLDDVNQISVGQEILFPALPSKNGQGRFTLQIGSFKDFKLAQEQFQKLIRSGKESYILPVSDREQFYRVTLGSFQNRPEAEAFALKLLKNNFSKDVEVIKINLN